MSLDPFRSPPLPHPPSFALSRRLERAVLLISLVVSAVGIAFFYGSVGGGIFSSPLTLVAAEVGVALVQLGLIGFAAFMRRRGIG